MIYIAVIFTFLIGGSYFAITDNAVGEPKEPATKGETSRSKSVRSKSARLSAEQIDKFRKRVLSCWDPPTEISGARDLRVTVDIKLSINGKILGKPTVVAMSDHPLARSAAEAVVSAVMRCQPYREFDPKKYNLYKRTRINFDLRDY